MSQALALKMDRGLSAPSVKVEVKVKVLRSRPMIPDFDWSGRAFSGYVWGNVPAFSTVFVSPPQHLLLLRYFENNSHNILQGNLPTLSSLLRFAKTICEKSNSVLM